MSTINILQINNKNKADTFKDFIYKVGDPILFTENDIYYPVLYNNLKGIIENILEEDKSIIFDIKIPVIITEFQIITQPIQILSFDENSTTIRIKINKYLGTSDYEDRRKDTVVPFQIAYAVSIHKAQGLEYDSVKIIITNEMEEYITHNIFYTVITRARKSLCIYWSPETQKRVIEGMKKIDISVDANIISNKYSLPLVRNK